MRLGNSLALAASPRFWQRGSFAAFIPFRQLPGSSSLVTVGLGPIPYVTGEEPRQNEERPPQQAHDRPQRNRPSFFALLLSKWVTARDGCDVLPSLLNHRVEAHRKIRHFRGLEQLVIVRRGGLDEGPVIARLHARGLVTGVKKNALGGRSAS